MGYRLRQVDRVFVLHEGRRLLCFATNDYFRLSSHPAVVAAFRAAAGEGLSAASSRLTTGEHPLYGELEAALARRLGQEAARVVPAGYLASLALLQALPQRRRAFLEARAHGSLRDAAAGLEVETFADGDPADLERRLARRGGPDAVVLAEGPLAGTGEIPPVAAYLAAAERYGAVLVVDDAHAAGVIGREGRGTLEHLGLAPSRAPQAGTLSKAFGLFGGFVAGSSELLAAVEGRSRAYVGATPFPPPVAAAALAALAVLADGEERRRLWANVRRLKEGLRRLGFAPPDNPVPIVSLALGDEARHRRLAAALLERGLFPPLIRYPGAPAAGHFRFTCSSVHTAEQVDLLLAAVAAGLGQGGG